MEAHDSDDRIEIPALLRAARGSYGIAVRQSLAAGGFDDMPANGSYVIGGLVNHAGTIEELVRQVVRTREQGVELVRTLVRTDYLQRVGDAAANNFEPTERGRAAAVAIRTGVDQIDTALAEHCTPEQIRGLRAGLIALCDIRERLEDETREARAKGQGESSPTPE